MTPNSPKARHARRVAAACALAVGLACVAPPPQPASDEPRGPRPPGAGILFTDAELETPDDETAMEIVVKGDAIHLYDDRDQKIATYRVEGDRRISFVDERSRRTGELVRDAESFTVRTGKDTPVVLTNEPDGDVLIRRDGKLLFDIKARDYGYKIVDATGNDLGRVRVGSNKIRVRNASRQDVRITKAPISTAAVACWLLPEIATHEAVAFVLAITVWGLPD